MSEFANRPTCGHCGDACGRVLIRLRDKNEWLAQDATATTDAHDCAGVFWRCEADILTHPCGDGFTFEPETLSEMDAQAEVARLGAVIELLRPHVMVNGLTPDGKPVRFCCICLIEGPQGEPPRHLPECPLAAQPKETA